MIKFRYKRESSVISGTVLRPVQQKTGIDFELALRRGFGIWKKRTDLGDTDNYVRTLRTDKRINGLYGRHSDML